MFVVLYGHVHYGWHITESFCMLYESLILWKRGHISLSLTLKENTISNVLLYTHYWNTYQQGS